MNDSNKANSKLMKEIEELRQENAALRESKKRYKTIIEDQEEMICRQLPDGTITFANNACCRFLEKNNKDLIGKSFLSFIPKEEREEVEKHFTSLTRKNPVGIFDFHIITSGGKEYWLRCTTRAIYDKSGKLLEYQGVGRDITKNKQIEDDLKESENKLRAFLENSPNFIIVVDRKGAIEYINHPAKKNERKDVIGKTIYEFIDPAYHGAHKKYIDQIYKTGRKARDTVIVRGPGLKRDFSWYETSFVPLKEDGKVVSAMLIANDITRLMEAEKAIKEAEERFRELFNNMSSGVAIYEALDSGKNFRIMNMNNSGARMSRARKEDIIGKMVTEAFPGVRDFGLFEVFQRVYKTGKPERYPTTFYKDQRISNWYDNYVYKLSTGEIIAVYDDVTERKQAEEGLRKSEEKFRLTFENANDAIFWADPKTGELINCNKQAEILTGRTKDELIGQDQTILHPPEKREHYINVFKEDTRRKRTINTEAEVITKTGEIKPVYITASTTIIDNTPIIQGIFHDITDLKEAENLLREQKDALQEKNVALREVLEQIEMEKKKISDDVIANMEAVLLPLVEKLKRRGASRKYATLLEKNLHEMTSTFGRKISEKGAKLTTRELEICNMIKNGLSSKEIADLLHVSLPTIDRHRYNIRKKLGIVKSDFNLTSYLKTL